MVENYYFVLDENGNPSVVKDITTWGKWYEGAFESRIVACEEINGTKISTVFLAINHAFGAEEPILYETMIFGGQHDGECWRYSTKEQAIKGHKNAVKFVSGRDK